MDIDKLEQIATRLSEILKIDLFPKKNGNRYLLHTIHGVWLAEYNNDTKSVKGLFNHFNVEEDLKVADPFYMTRCEVNFDIWKCMPTVVCRTANIKAGDMVLRINSNGKYYIFIVDKVVDGKLVTPAVVTPNGRKKYAYPISECNKILAVGWL